MQDRHAHAVYNSAAVTDAEVMTARGFEWLGIEQSGGMSQ